MKYEEIKPKASVMFRCWAFLDYKDRVEIWKDAEMTGDYELHRVIRDKDAVKRVYGVNL